MYKKTMYKKMLLMLTGTGLLFGTVFGLYFMMMQGMAKGMAGHIPPPIPVTATVTTGESWHSYLTSTGTLRARQGIDVRTEVPGIINALGFYAGAAVAKGELLAQLADDIERATLKNNQAHQKLARLTWERDQSLLQRNAISQTQFDQSSANLEQATAAVEQTQAILNNKKITAPFAGRAGISMIEPGDYLKEGEVLVTLQNINQLYLDFSVPEQDYPQLFIGQTVHFSVPAYPDETFIATIDAINARVDSNTRNIEVRAIMDNKDQRLMPGMFTDLQIFASQPRDVITLPRTAITYSLYGDSVYIIRSAAPLHKPKQPEPKQPEPKQQPDQLTVEQIQVKTGEIRGKRIEIISGLHGGEQVVDGGQLKLRNGARITIQPNGE